MNKVAGEQEIPAANLTQCPTFWDEPVHLMSEQNTDGQTTWHTLPLQPCNPHAAHHPAYTATAGDIWCTTEDGVTFCHYLGTYEPAAVTERGVLMRCV